MDYIPVNKPLFIGNEKKYLNECIDTGWISSEGPFVKKFENVFSRSVKRKHGIAVSSGSAALDISIKALDIKKGDEVIVPSFTIISPVYSILRQGGVPVLVDSCEDTWNMDVTKIESKITKKTKAIIVVHIYGLPVDIDPILNIAKKYGIKVIEDAAEMHGQTYKGKPCGSFGDISIFSFYPNKHITTGEGGMIVLNDDDLAEKCLSLRNLCFGEKRFVHHDIGWNYRMSNLQAAVGLAQFEVLNNTIKRKREIGLMYNQLLKDIKGINLPITSTNYAQNIYWVYGIVMDNLLAEEVIQKLSEKKIGTRPFFCPMNKQPILNKLFSNEKCPIAEKLYKHGLYIPSGGGLTDEEIQKVSKRLHEVL